MKVDIEKIKIAQAKACLSVNELVEKTNLGRATVSRILNGTSNPSAKSAGLLAKALNVEVTELVSEK